MAAFDRRVNPEVREVQRLEVISGALGRASLAGRGEGADRRRKPGAECGDLGGGAPARSAAAAAVRMAAPGQARAVGIAGR